MASSLERKDRIETIKRSAIGQVVSEFRETIGEGNKIACLKCHVVVGKNCGAGDGNVARVCQGVQLVKLREGKIVASNYELAPVDMECIVAGAISAGMDEEE